MKTFSLFFLSIALLVPVSLAGNFGPAPFRNGSPLVSGNDGTYQATARAENVTGIFRFAYSGGSQTGNPSQNNWIFFIEGQIQKGTVQANLSESNLDGILDSASSVSSSSSNGTISLPYIVLSQNNNSAGVFSGKLQQKSPNGAFSGQGTLQGLPDTPGEVFIIAEQSVSTGAGATARTFTSITATTTPYILTGGNISQTSFKFRGVRTSTTSTPTAAPTPATTQ
jgi:hypothetical protein